MIEMTCWRCGWAGRAYDRFARRLAACKRCRAVNVVPPLPPRKVYPLGLAVAIDAPSSAPG